MAKKRQKCQCSSKIMVNCCLILSVSKPYNNFYECRLFIENIKLQIFCMEANHFYMLQDCDVNERFLKNHINYG